MNDIVSVVDIFDGESFRVFTPNKDDFIKVLDFCDRNGIRWAMGDLASSSKHSWYSYENDTRVTFNITKSNVYITYGCSDTDDMFDNYITTQQLLSLCQCKYADISDLL